MFNFLYFAVLKTDKSSKYLKNPKKANLNIYYLKMYMSQIGPFAPLCDGKVMVDSRVMAMIVVLVLVIMVVVVVLVVLVVAVVMIVVVVVWD